MSPIAIAGDLKTHTPRGSLGTLALGALGVVYGDIGTSPLYTMKTALDWGGGATPEVAVGMLSLIVWTLLITTSIKYVAVVMRADNDGEGGIVAPMSLLGIKHGNRAGVIAIGVLGAALLYGDGAITLAISVLSALEGLKLPAPGIAPYVVPLSVPLVVLATLATIIASQAIISGSFSMTRQAMQLGLCPRLHITQTSAEGYGQIYVGSVNWVLMALTLGLTLAFRSSDNLAAAFGVAVSLTMLLTSVLMYLVMREIWGWSLPASLLVAGSFIVVDLSFVSANLMKVFEGGYVPLIVAAVIFFLIWTWRRGRQLMLQRLERDTLPLASFIKQIHGKSRVPGTAVYLTSRTDVVPVPLLHNLKHNKVIHRRIVLLHVVTGNAPYIAVDQRIQVTHLMDDFHSVVIRYGFMEQPDIPQALDACAAQELRFDLMETSFFVGRLTIVPGAAPRMSRIRINLFEAMHRNALAATEFFRIPPNRVIELGGQIEL